MNDNDSNENIGFSVEYMDKSANPRDDFYRFANGKWVDMHPLPADMPSFGAFRELSELNRKKLHTIAEDCAAGNIDAGAYGKLVGDFYSAAMNTEKLEELKFKPMGRAWDIVDSIDSREALAKAIPELHLLGVYPFFAAFAPPDDKNSAIYAFYLTQSGLSLPDRDYYLKDNMAEIRRYYLQHIKKMFLIYRMDEKTADEWANTVLDLETKIAKVSWASEELTDDVKNYNNMSIEELEKRYANLRLLEYMKRFEVPPVSYVIVRQPDFFDAINSMVMDESLERIKIYMHWKVINNYAALLHKEVDDEHFDMFGRKLLGQKEQRARWKRATGVVSAYIGEALGAVYVKRHFDEESKKKAEQLVSDLIEAFRKRINSLEWMSDKTKSKAIEKLDRMVVMVGYPGKFRDYSGLVIGPDDYVGNVIRASAFETLREMRRVGKQVDKEEWYMSPQDVNAYNSPPDNRIVFPAGILQPPFFDKEMGHAVNYGGIGSVIGHEMTHGFDNNGRKHDAEGNLNDWWTEEDEKRFNELAADVAKEYSAEEVLPEVFINGKLTMDENLADLGGLNITYDALMKRLEKEPEGGVNADGLTHEQRFFISYAQVWRDVASKEDIERRILSDPHSPDRIRAIIPAMNNPAFDRAFPPKGGEQADKKRIGVW